MQLPDDEARKIIEAIEGLQSKHRHFYYNQRSAKGDAAIFALRLRLIQGETKMVTPYITQEQFDRVFPDKPAPQGEPEEKKHPFVLWGEYESRIESLTNEVAFHKGLTAKALMTPPVTQEITRLKSIIEDMELAAASRQSAQPVAQQAPKEPTNDELEQLFCKITGLETGINPAANDTKCALVWFKKGYRMAPQPAQQEPLVRYCPDCGRIGPLPEGAHVDCCPDGQHARMVPENFAKSCHDTFMRSIS